MKSPENVLESRLTKSSYENLMSIENASLHQFIAKYVTLCNPAKVVVCTDSENDIWFTRQAALQKREEAPLAVKGHTVHFDGYYDQARDKEHTKFLIPEGVDLGPEINAMDREKGLQEIHSILENSMEGHDLFVKFFSLGPPGSVFTIPCVQLTDSAYVAHSEDLLYRQGYQEFVRLGEKAEMFKFVHSQGRLESAGLNLKVSKTIDKRRVYIDLKNEIIFSANTQYGGNTIGLKKLAMRLAITRASRNGWLTEHMLVMGVHGPEKRVSYVTGAFPSMCGKTSTAMLEGESIVGDDIAYLRSINGRVRAVNVEKGVFGIIEGINSADDPLQWKALHEPEEIIFSNVLITDDRHVYWNGKDGDCPLKGVNYSGQWVRGKTDEHKNEILPSHKNARFTLELEILDTVDSNLHNPQGVHVSGLIFGGRDSDTWVPVEEAFDWVHGVITKGAALESETTAATLGKEGVRVFNPMSNLDFLSIPIGRYIKDYLDFGAGLDEIPKVFSVNYFLKGPKGKFLNHKNDKQVWLKWMDLRIHNEADAITAPTGFIPLYQDLQSLFKETLNKDYSKSEYRTQFTIRCPENVAKIDRLTEIYQTRVRDTPKVVFEVLGQQKKRLEKAQSEYGDYIEPDVLVKNKSP